ncbi:hypothetical protein LHP98_19260, partial [Rhodobacter sp. Har01]|uniref:hypothetical protein n=1 Tax=Rhodobacter sp. Har01 TaxID=2883999 RepID=UPI001D083E38
EPRDFQVNTSLTDLDNPVVDQRGASEMNSLIAAVFLLPVTVLAAWAMFNRFAMGETREHIDEAAAVRQAFSKIETELLSLLGDCSAARLAWSMWSATNGSERNGAAAAELHLLSHAEVEARSALDQINALPRSVGEIKVHNLRSMRAAISVLTKEIQVQRHVVRDSLARFDDGRAASAFRGRSQVLKPVKV